jgi:hypothetical protein
MALKAIIVQNFDFHDVIFFKLRNCWFFDKVQIKFYLCLGDMI